MVPFNANSDPTVHELSSQISDEVERRLQDWPADIKWMRQITGDWMDFDPPNEDWTYRQRTTTAVLTRQVFGRNVQGDFVTDSNAEGVENRSELFICCSDKRYFDDGPEPETENLHLRIKIFDRGKIEINHSIEVRDGRFIIQEQDGLDAGCEDNLSVLVILAKDIPMTSVMDEPPTDKEEILRAFFQAANDFMAGLGQPRKSQNDLLPEQVKKQVELLTESIGSAGSNVSSWQHRTLESAMANVRIMVGKQLLPQLFELSTTWQNNLYDAEHGRRGRSGAKIGHRIVDITQQHATTQTRTTLTINTDQTLELVAAEAGAKDDKRSLKLLLQGEVAVTAERLLGILRLLRSEDLADV